MNSTPTTPSSKPAASAGPDHDAAPAAEGTEQRDALLESERQANSQQPRNFKEDALTDKVVHVDPDGTGPSPIGSMDPAKK